MSVSSTRLALLDYLRFAAAFAVVAYHWLFWLIASGTVTTLILPGIADVAAYGYLGVHLFFLISGFVIFFSARSRTPSEFAIGRGKRLYPAFWASLVLVVAVAFIGGESLGSLLPKIAANITMYPKAFGVYYLDGVYWTLAYELRFYALVFLLLLFGLGRHLDRIFPVWAVLMLAATLVSPDIAAIPFLGEYYALFAGGAILASTSAAGWSALRAIGLFASATTVCIYTTQSSETVWPNQSVGEYSTVALVAIILAFFALIYAQTLKPVARLVLPGSRKAGALTYIPCTSSTRSSATRSSRRSPTTGTSGWYAARFSSSSSSDPSSYTRWSRGGCRRCGRASSRSSSAVRSMSSTAPSIAFSGAFSCAGPIANPTARPYAERHQGRSADAGEGTGPQRHPDGGVRGDGKPSRLGAGRRKLGEGADARRGRIDQLVRAREGRPHAAGRIGGDRVRPRTGRERHLAERPVAREAHQNISERLRHPYRAVVGDRDRRVPSAHVPDGVRLLEREPEIIARHRDHRHGRPSAPDPELVDPAERIRPPLGEPGRAVVEGDHAERPRIRCGNADRPDLSQTFRSRAEAHEPVAFGVGDPHCRLGSGRHQRRPRTRTVAGAPTDPIAVGEREPHRAIIGHRHPVQPFAHTGPDRMLDERCGHRLTEIVRS